MAQTTSSTNGLSSTMSTLSTSATPSSSANLMTVIGSTVSPSQTPVCTDAAGGCGADGTDPNGNGTGVSSYYYVFLAIILCVVGIGTFLVWRKKRRARYWGHGGRETALANDLTAWDPARHRRRQRQGRWRSAETSREEGLNEHGEAPPPYFPKSQEEEQAMREREGGAGPAVPLQTLSREDAGLKPPDYTETHARAAGDVDTPSNGDSSRAPHSGHDV